MVLVCKYLSLLASTPTSWDNFSILKMFHMYHVIYLRRGRKCNGDWKEYFVLCMRMIWSCGVIANSSNRGFSFVKAGNGQQEKQVDDKGYQHPTPPQQYFTSPFHPECYPWDTFPFGKRRVCLQSHSKARRNLQNGWVRSSWRQISMMGF